MKSNGKKGARYAVLIMVLLLGVAGCKTKQKVTSPELAETVKKESPAPDLIKPMAPKIASLNYEWLSYRMNVAILDYNSKKETMSVSAFFVNRKDSIIYVAISKLGIEGARVVATPDSVKYLNHLTSTYYSGDYSFLNKLLGFNVNFHILQSIFAGDDIPGFEPNTLLKIIGDTNIYTSSLRKNEQMNLSISQEIKTNRNHKVIENNIKEIKNQVSIGIRYGDFINIDDSQLFFQQTELALPTENMLLNFSIKNIKVNVPGPTSMRIPEKYKPIDLK